MAHRLIIVLIFFVNSALPAVGQNLNANDTINLGNQILNDLSQPKGRVRQPAPVRTRENIWRQAPAKRQAQKRVQTSSGDYALVYQTQALLAQLGFDPGPLDGVMGKRTANAIRQFQAMKAFEPTGQVSRELITQLRSSDGLRGGVNTKSKATAPTFQSISPSFNCDRAATIVEMAICRSRELAQLDRALSSAYSAQRDIASSLGASRLASDQKAWLAQRDRCGASIPCLSTSMIGRIAQLGGTLPQGAGNVVSMHTANSERSGPDGNPATIPQITSQAYIVDGRYAIFHGSFYSPPAGIKHDVYKSQHIAALERLFDLVGIVPGDERFTNGNWPLWTGDFLGKSILKALAAEAANGVITREIQNELNRPIRQGRFSLTENIQRNLANDFERQRFSALIKKNVAEFVPSLLPQVPVPVRLYCRLEMKKNPETLSPLYDSINEAFYVVNFSQHCGNNTGANTIGRTPWPAVGDLFRGGKFEFEIGTQDHPIIINLPPNRAEQFVNISAKHSVDIGFDAELMAYSTRSQNDELITKYAIRRTGSYKLYYHDQPDTPIYEFTPEQLEPKPLTAVEKQARRLGDMDRVWTFNQLDEQQVLLDLAEARGSYSEKLFDGDEILTFSVRPRIGNWETVTSPVLETGLKDGLDFRSARTVAESLGRPLTSIFAAPMGLVGLGGSPISRVFVALPDVLENYKRPAPETDQKLNLVVNFQMKKVWQLPTTRGRPEILIFAVPVSGAYYPAEKKVGAPVQPVSEFRFDTAVPMDYSHSRLARPRDVVAAVAQSIGSDTAELIESIYPSSSQNAFARRDEIEMLASTADPVDLHGFWMTGNGQFADFDYEQQTFGFNYLNSSFSDYVSRNERRIARAKIFELTNLDEAGGIRFPMLESEARRLQQEVEGSDAIYRALIVADTPIAIGGKSGLPIQARIAEIVVLRPGSDAQVEIDANIIARIDISSDSETTTTDLQIVPATTVLGTYDILDVRIRQAFDSVLPAIETSFEPETVLYGRREFWVGQQNLRRPITPTTALSESTILVRDGGSDSLTIFHEPLLPNNPVTGIARTMSFAVGARPSPDAVKALLLDKYGDMAKKHNYAFNWFRDTRQTQLAPNSEMSMSELLELSTSAQNEQTRAFQCKQHLSGLTLQLDNFAQSLLRTGYSKFTYKPYPVVDENNTPMLLPAPNPLWPVLRVESSNPKCGEDFVVAAIEPDSNGLVSVLRILVTNRAYLADIETKAKRALIDNQASGQGSIPKIKL